MTIRHNLPPRPYRRLIGREAELSQIQQRISARSRDWIVAIEGIGGVGKTALALEAGWQCVETAARQPKDERFTAVIWATAKREMLTLGGIVPDSPTLASLDDLFVAAARVLEEPGVLQAARGKRYQEVWRLLQRSERVLFILDNLEDADDPDLLPFLRDMPAYAKVVATLRFHEDLPDPIELTRLDQAATARLVRMEFDAHRVSLSTEHEAELARAACGVPLVVRWAAGLSDEVGAEGALQRLKDPGKDLPRYLFDHSVERLRLADADAYCALLACTFFEWDTGAGEEALAATLGFEPARARRALAQLTRLNLIDGVSSDSGTRFRLLPLAHRYARGWCRGEERWERAARARWVEYYKGFVGRDLDATDYPRLRAEISNLVRVLKWLAQRASEHEQALHLDFLFGALQQFLYGEVRWDEILESARALLTYVESVTQRDALTADMLVSVLQTPIDIFNRRGECKGGELWLKRAQAWAHGQHTERLDAQIKLAEARLKCNDGTMITYAAMAKMLSVPPEDVDRVLTDRVREAQTAIEGVLPSLHRWNLNHRAVQALNTLGNCYRAMDRAQEAWERYDEAIKRLDEVPQEFRHTVSHLRPVIRGNRALVAGRLGRFAQACAELREVLPELVERTDQVEAYAALALYEYRLGNVAAARKYRRQADELKTRYNLTDLYLCREDRQWEELEMGRRVRSPS